MQVYSFEIDFEVNCDLASSHSNSNGALLFLSSVLIWSPRESTHIHHSLVFLFGFWQPRTCAFRFGPHTRHTVPHLIFVIFSPPIQFLAQFFSTQKHVNRAKTDFAKTV